MIKKITTIWIFLWGLLFSSHFVIANPGTLVIAPTPEQINQDSGWKHFGMRWQNTTITQQGDLTLTWVSETYPSSSQHHPIAKELLSKPVLKKNGRAEAEYLVENFPVGFSFTVTPPLGHKFQVGQNNKLEIVKN